MTTTDNTGSKEDIVNQYEMEQEKPLLSNVLLDQGERLFKGDGHVLLKFPEENGISFGKYFVPLKNDQLISIEPLVLVLKEESYQTQSLEHRKSQLLLLADQACTATSNTFSLEGSQVIIIEKGYYYFWVKKQSIKEAMRN